MDTAVQIAETPAIPTLTHDSWADELDAREQAFVLEYVRTLKVERSAIKAGYAKTVARVQAYGWLSKTVCTKPHVKRAADFLLREKANQVLVSPEWIIEQLRAVAGADIRDVLTFRAHKVTDADQVDGIVTIRESVSNTVEIFDSEELDDETAAAIKSIKQDKDGNVTIEMHGKVQALTTLAKIHGLLAADTHKHLHMHIGGDKAPAEVTPEMSPAQAAEAWRAMLAKDDEE